MGYNPRGHVTVCVCVCVCERDYMIISMDFCLSRHTAALLVPRSGT